ncbi:MAG: hypothetical protein SVR04_07735 [Spirochaetota bacterium]|nr:hypothetical protein [Spirochaetota bacterium]
MQRLKRMCSLAFLLTAAATVGWTGHADPWGLTSTNPVDEYSAYVRDQSLLYSQRLYEGETGVNERLRLADEYHRDLEERLHLLMEEWESTARDELLSRRIDPFQGNSAVGASAETADMEAYLASRKQRYLRECEQVGELFNRHYVLPELDRRSGEGGGSVFSNDPQIFLDMAMLADKRTGTAGIQSVYRSEEDYWKLTGSGAVLWDGSHHLWTEGGKLMVPHQSGSFSRDIADYLEISQEEARVLMEKAGLIWDSGLGTYRQEESDYYLTTPSGLYAQYELLNRFGEKEEGDVPVTGNQAYAWAVREHALRAGSGSYGDREYEQGMAAGLSSRENFLETAGLKGGTEFPGITGRADLHTYSQQWLEMSTAGRALDGSRGEGYCLAESIACRYVDRYEKVNWEAVRSAFAGTDWGPAFDPTTGMVGDKQLFTAKLAASFDVDSTATEYRFDALSGAQDFIRQSAGDAGARAEYSVVADYGGHFTHVRPDGLEINTYPGWSSVGREPREWRVYLWD